MVIRRLIATLALDHTISSPCEVDSPRHEEKDPEQTDRPNPGIAQEHMGSLPPSPGVPNPSPEVRVAIDSPQPDGAVSSVPVALRASPSPLGRFWRFVDDNQMTVYAMWILRAAFCYW
jgi:hypothetical protein